MAGAILQGAALRYSYRRGQPVLHGVNVSLAAHTVLYMLGHNGCGKTTLLELLGGVRTPQSGTVQLNGTDVYRLPAHVRAQQIGLVPQTHTPVFAYDVREVVTMGRTPYLGFLGTPSSADRNIVEQALERVGLLDLAARPYTELSGGERQLVLIARGLAQQTEVLLLDEPTAHLDPRNQRIVLETVSQLAAEQRVSFVISSHNPNSALLYADQVLVIKNGQVVVSGLPHDVLTEETLSQSYDMPVEVVYNQDRVARAIVPRRDSHWT
ncbi:MAG: ABC transporter ATP-binding protein [Anaerolineae bacterium]|nr:ABC transporter ATP-binding protein [Anaerolineae bacterium]